MIELLDEEQVDLLRNIADQVRERGTVSGYGYFPGGDPREFWPDSESCTPEELERHREACARLEAGEAVQVGSNHTDIIGDDGKPCGHLTHPVFGMGGYTIVDPACAALAAELDAWVDACRQES